MYKIERKYELPRQECKVESFEERIIKKVMGDQVASCYVRYWRQWMLRGQQ